MTKGKKGGRWLTLSGFTLFLAVLFFFWSGFAPVLQGQGSTLPAATVMMAIGVVGLAWR